MGCDIHLFVETRESKDAPWVLVGVETPCRSCEKSSGRYADGRECYTCKGSGVDKGFDDRNYSLFGMLANVRNGRGFGGISTGTGFNPISEPRGLPEDASEALRPLVQEVNGQEEQPEDRYDLYRMNYGCGWLGDHSFSHLTLAELQAYDWKQTTVHTGCVDVGTYAAWKKSGEQYPSHWSGGVSGPSVHHVSVAMVEELLTAIEEWSVTEHPYDRPHPLKLTPAGERLVTAVGGPVGKFLRGDKTIGIYTQMAVQDTYESSAGAFYSVFMPALAKLGDPANVRIVFGFDS